MSYDKTMQDFKWGAMLGHAVRISERPSSQSGTKDFLIALIQLAHGLGEELSEAQMEIYRNAFVGACDLKEWVAVCKLAALEFQKTSWEKMPTAKTMLSFLAKVRAVAAANQPPPPKRREAQPPPVEDRVAVTAILDEWRASIEKKRMPPVRRRTAADLINEAKEKGIL